MNPLFGNVSTSPDWNSNVNSALFCPIVSVSPVSQEYCTSPLDALMIDTPPVRSSRMSCPLSPSSSENSTESTVDKSTGSPPDRCNVARSAGAVSPRFIVNAIILILPHFDSVRE